MLSSPFLASPNSASLLCSPSSNLPRRVRVRLQPTRCAAASTAVPPTPLYAAAAAKTTTLYDVLCIPASASRGEIKAAYRRLARTCHPDVVAAACGGASTAEEFMRVHAAYATLSDPAKRAEYDRGAGAAAMAARRWETPGEHRPLYTSGSSPGRSGRRWETDQCW